MALEDVAVRQLQLRVPLHHRATVGVGVAGEGVGIGRIIRVVGIIGIIRVVRAVVARIVDIKSVVVGAVARERVQISIAGIIYRVIGIVRAVIVVAVVIAVVIAFVSSVQCGVVR